VRDLVRLAVDHALERGATYADARAITREVETLEVKNGAVAGAASETESGIGVRVIARGAWGFAATADLDRAAIERAVETALRIARAGARASAGEVELAAAPAARASWKSQFQVDPFQVPLDEKVRVLLEADRLAHSLPEVKVSMASMRFQREHKFFASSEGSDLEQERLESGGQLSVTAASAEELQERSYPSALDGFHAARGYEVIREINLPAAAEKTAKQAVDLLTAKPCPSGEMPILIEGSQMALQIHESCGHPTELDRVFGAETSYAGTSFLTPDKLGHFRYGSEKVNLVADATAPGGLGTFGYDDEGVAAQKTDLVREGIFRGYLSSRETAQRLGQASGGTMRAEAWNHIPLVRMTNVNLEPGDWSLEEMIEDVGKGLYLETTRSWSIDDQRLNFQFATQAAWEIEDGSLGALVRNATYQGVTPDFWGSCDAVGNAKTWRLWGVVNCAKGEPVQLMHVGHGAAPTRFSRVRVGVLQHGGGA
jgi:TldD protein